MSTKFKKYFKGLQISVVMKSIKGTQEIDGSVFSGNHIVDGEYVDDDSNFLFLADSTGNVVEALLKKDIVRVFINNPLNDGSLPPDNIN